MNPVGKLSVLLPSYDERQNIRPLIDAIVAELDGQEYEIIVIDDDSPDLTWQEVERIGRENQRVRLIRRRHERGLTSALNEGIRAAQGDAVMWMDCDFQHPVSLIPHLVDTLNRGYDAALASRYCPGAGGGKPARPELPLILRLHRRLAGMLNRLTSCLLRAAVTDWTSGYLAIRRHVFDDYALSGEYGEYYIRLMHHIATRGYSFTELPYELDVRTAGYSKTTSSYGGFIFKGTRYIATLLSLTFARRG